MLQTCKSLYSSPANHYFLPNPEWQLTPLSPLGITSTLSEINQSMNEQEAASCVSGITRHVYLRLW